MKGKDQHTYDAIVVGSGITGGLVAKELCEKGLNVLMIERGRNIDHPNDYKTANLDPWQLPHRNNLSQEEKERSPIQSRHFSYREDTAHFHINDVENPYTETKRYDWVRADVLGGRSLLWGRYSYRLSDYDFDANRKDGVGIDWPIRYKDLEPWYDYVEKYVGVSGQKDGIPNLPDGKFLPPMEMNCVERHFKETVEKKFNGRRVIIGRTANLTEPIHGRGQCQYRNLCHRGCPYGGYFSTNSCTLPDAKATGKLTLLTDTLVNQVIYDETKQRAAGVEAMDRNTGKVSEYFSRLVFLNASTLGTSFILLNSISNRFPNGLGNGSDQVGRNLMDHFKGCIASAEVEGFEDQYYTGKRPTSIYVPRFRNIHDKQPDYLRGFGIQGGASREGWGRLTRSEELGEGLKAQAQQPGLWRMNTLGYGECLPYADNRVTLNKEKTDKWGRPTLTIDCEFKENEKAMNKDMIAVAQEMYEASGFKNIKVADTMSFPGNSNHEMGTARMGKDPKTSVLNAFNQMHEVPNVFITDGSCMTSSSCANPSLTYMALTARACHYAVEELKKMNL